MIKIRSPKVRLTLICCAILLIVWLLCLATSSVASVGKKRGSILDVQGARILVDEPVLDQGPKPFEGVAGIHHNALLDHPKEAVIQGMVAVHDDIKQKKPVYLGETDQDALEKQTEKISPDQKQAVLDKFKMKDTLEIREHSTHPSILPPVAKIEPNRTATLAFNATSPKPAAIVLNTSTSTQATTKLPPTKAKPRLSQVFVTRRPLPSNQHVPISNEFFMLMHGGKASKVHTSIHETLTSMPSEIPREFYILSSQKLPEELTLRPNIGNGFLATVIHSKEVFMAGLFNGNGPQSHRAVLPSTVSLAIKDVTPAQELKRSYNLNVGEGIYSEHLTGPAFNITQKIFAHRTIKQLLVVEIDFVRSVLGEEVELNVELNKWTASYDVTFVKKDSGHEGVSYKVGRINAPESSDSPSTEVHMLYDHVPNVLKTPSKVLRTKWVFLTAIGKTNAEVSEAYTDGIRLIHNSDDLYASHVRAWADVWQKGRIDIAGNADLARTTYSSWYYLLSSLPLKEDPTMKFVGISPSGLALGDQNKDYQGHVSVDQELWMFPPLLEYHPETARVILSSRVNTFNGALSNAQKAGVRGIQFAFESGVSGLELSADPTRGQHALYVSSAVSMAIMRYLDATNDTRILDRSYKDILVGIATFILHKATLNPNTDRHEFRGVKSPDLLHPSVDNSAFVSSICQFALSAPKTAFSRIQQDSNLFQNVADSVYVPFNSDIQFHPAYDGYSHSEYTPLTPIHQADTVLLGYPLQRFMTASTRKNDLIIYQSATDPKAPPTTWAMHTIGWLEVGELKKASANFIKQQNYTSKDFKACITNLHETPSLSASNYISGAGAFLQSLHNGYGGFRIRDNRLDLNPVLPENVPSLSYIGIDYLGFTLDVHVAVKEISIIVTGLSSRGDKLNLMVHQTQQIYTLSQNSPQRFVPTKASLYSNLIDLPNTL
ncbi:hypothetical protein CAPTEDRAFT_169684 [Capitella teleta]|uniref:Uncharacterized protein n=1 Tax=Capitella teleta TaxID=283909 RepID=R7UAB2_CAPTE|nr:hypothetical protein CAPTEDRAFT_169684 [Capitella teleta]|eukprot:ELU02904.1 hypothetical protein CAPTEDRAFT_169684 [Capitella teleta]